ncbi:hypothetical protein BFL36_06530 [Clavibacter michiganensis]|uniref:DUF4190 domain-containing protein n=1 Tax=Clavibacter michiganensis TaxID=28447 RepID=A0A251YIF0_9MICO|nr:DUF4190 domain-containing protein [Clavibacter michiganensis]OUE24020.1 hypothetical protein BFL36_06530 [Clavibacter michiganensis]
MTDPQNPDRSQDGFPPAPSQPAYPAAPAAGSDSPYAAPYQPGQGGAPVSKGLSITSMVLGIVSVVTSLVWFLSVPLGIAALVTGILGRKRTPEAKGFWLTGIITGVVGIVLSIVFVVLAIAVAKTLQEQGYVTQ